MRIFLTFFLAVITFGISFSGGPVKESPIVLVIHGGAGNINREKFSDERKREYIEKLQVALDEGYKILDNGGTSLDAVEKAINILENDPWFNAGRGAVLTSKGEVEMDASIMDGKTKNAGAVASVTTIRNPVTAARMVMEKSPHVMLVGRGAEEFSKELGLNMEERSYFRTEKRYRAWKKYRQRLKDKEDPSDDGDGIPYSAIEDSKFGTVGAVALDKDGNLAAGTSTGGMTNKKYGRVGDSPIIGAGTYADNATCAVSATGHGEYFIRNVVAYDVTALMKYEGLNIGAAASKVIYEKLEELGGTGGIIVLDKDGNIAMPFNTSAMFRGYRNSDGENKISIFK